MTGVSPYNVNVSPSDWYMYLISQVTILKMDNELNE